MPRTQVKLSSGDVLTVDSLAGVVQLNALRSFLADGFQAHLQVGAFAKIHSQIPGFGIHLQLNALRSFLADGFQAHLQVGVWPRSYLHQLPSLCMAACSAARGTAA